MRMNLLSIRKKKGMTQEELCEKSGVSRATIVYLENDASTNTTTTTLVKLANALGCSVRDLFFDATDN